MLKKLFLSIAFCVCFSTFAEFTFSKKYFSQIDDQKVQEINQFLKQTKDKTKKFICEIILKQNENKQKYLTIEEMEEVAKRYFSEKRNIVCSIINYAYCSSNESKYVDLFLKRDEYKTEPLFLYLVSMKSFNVKNANDFRIQYIRYLLRSKNYNVNSYTRIIDYAISDCMQDTEENAIKTLKTLYRMLLPKVAEVSDFKQIVTKIGLALRSYGVDVK